MADKKWWFSDYDFDHRGHTYDRDSGVLSWMSRLRDITEKAPDVGAEYQQLLNQLQNSANVMNDGETLKIRWAADKDKNNTKQDNILRLNPDGLVSEDGKVDHRKLDALTGRVYMASMIHNLSHANSWALSRRLKKAGDPASKIGIQIWEAMETAIARQAIVREWTGFTPSVVAESSDSCASREQVQNYIDSTADRPTAEAAAIGMSWNLLNPATPVKMPAAYHAAIEEAASLIEDSVAAEDRCRTAADMADVLMSYFGIVEDEQPNGGNGPSRNGPLGSSMPATHDGSVFGEEMEVETDPELELKEQAAEANPGNRPDGKVPGKGAPDLGMIEDVKARFHEQKGDKVVEYRARVKALQSSIRHIINSLLFNNAVPSADTYGHRSGEIDEGNLHKLFMDDDRLMYRREVITRKRIAVTILLDESGSMCDGNRYAKARDVGIVLYEALRRISGIDTSVYGHTTSENGYGSEDVMLYQYVTPSLRENAASLMRVAARSNNIDSWAMYHIGKKMITDYPEHERRLMFLISDGQPAGSQYGGESAIAHMAQVCGLMRKNNVNIYGVGVDNAYPRELGDDMYGRGNSVVLADVSSSAFVIGKFLRQLTKSM